MKKIVSKLLRSVLILTICIGYSQSSSAQSAEEGAKLFTANCTSCHAINDKVVGPALKDVHKRRDEAWLTKWIRNSQAMVKAGDATAVQLFNENNQSVMTSFEQLTDKDIKSLLAYIKAESEAPAATASATSSSNTNSSVSAASVSSEPNEGLSTKINWLLVIIGALLVIVIVQVVDILGVVGEIQGKPVINWNIINSKALLGFGVIGIGLSIWEFMAHSKLTVNAQEPASAHGAEYESMFMITLILTGIVFIITQILLFWYGYKYKHSSKRKALYYADNHTLEIWWTIIPAIVLTALVIRGLQTWTKIMNHNDKDAQVVEVFGYQFAWNARYPGADNALGKYDWRQVGQVNALGVDPRDPKSLDDVVTSEIHLAVNKPVLFKFRAKDVIHSAYLPHFRVQMNVVPGLPTQFAFTPTLTTSEMRTKLNDPSFDYVLLCNKICGSAHYRMKMKVIVDSPEEYQKWMDAQPKYVQANAPAAAPETAPSDSAATTKTALLKANGNKQLANK